METNKQSQNGDAHQDVPKQNGDSSSKSKEMKQPAGAKKQEGSTFYSFLKRQVKQLNFNKLNFTKIVFYKYSGQSNTGKTQSALMYPIGLGQYNIQTFRNVIQNPYLP